MRAVFGVVSLLVALAIVGLITVRQMKATRLAPAAAASQAGMVLSNPGGTPAAQSQAIQKQVGDDAAKALAEGAARSASADQ